MTYPSAEIPVAASSAALEVEQARVAQGYWRPGREGAAVVREPFWEGISNSCDERDCFGGRGRKGRRI